MNKNVCTHAVSTHKQLLHLVEIESHFPNLNGNITWKPSCAIPADKNNI